MATLIYTEKAGDTLKLLAEVGEDNVELAVDALLDEMPKLASQQPFVCFPSDSRMVVEASEEVVQPRRQITINGAKRQAAPKRTTRTKAAPAEVPEESGEVETAPKPATRRTRTANGKAGTKPTPRTSSGAKKQTGKTPPKPRTAAGKAPAAKKGGSPFKRNAKSDE